VSRCGRCDWRSEPELAETGREQLAGHADLSGHAICGCCERSLTAEEVRTCEPCLTESRSLLAMIIRLWEELPKHLGHLRGAAGGGAKPAVDGRPLPGGAVLVLLGPGSEGLAETGETTRDGDPSSVAFELTWWAKNWKEIRDASER
jgi:hypothetical protein